MRNAGIRVFIAGAGGAIGMRLVPMLVEAGHVVTATTRTPAKADALRALGAEPVIVDGLNGDAVAAAVARAEPGVIIHQMTALAGVTNLRRFDREFAVTNQLRRLGTGRRGDRFGCSPLHRAELLGLAVRADGR